MRQPTNSSLHPSSVISWSLSLVILLLASSVSSANKNRLKPNSQPVFKEQIFHHISSPRDTSAFLVVDDPFQQPTGLLSDSMGLVSVGQMYLDQVSQGFSQLLDFVENYLLLDAAERIQKRKRRFQAFSRRISNVENEIKNNAPQQYLSEVVFDPQTFNLEKRQPPDCSGIGILNTSNSSLYNCSGNIQPINSGLISCDTCGTGDSTCQANCCTPLDPSLRQYCTCPADRTGLQCEIQEPWSCKLTLISPNLTCSQPNASILTSLNLYSDPNCLKFKQSDNITLSLKLNCKMDQPLKLDVAEVGPGTAPDFTAGAFNYYARRGNEFALSLDPVQSVALKIFNFYKFSDDLQTQLLYLNSSHFLGTHPINFTINLAQVTNETFQTYMNGVMVTKKKYVTGGRVYLEIGFQYPKTIDGLSSYYYFRNFIDFSDLPTSPPSEYLATGTFEATKSGKITNGTWVVIGLSVGVVCGFYHISYKRRKQKRSRPSPH